MNVSKKLLLIVMLLVIPLASAMTVNNTVYSSVGLNTNLTINKSMSLSAIDVQTDYIYLQGYKDYLGSEYLTANLNITSSNTNYYYNNTQNDLVYISLSLSTSKVITNNLPNNYTINLNNISTIYCNGNVKDKLDSLTVSQGTINSYTCSNGILSVNMFLLTGNTTLTLVRENGAVLMSNWIGTFAAMFALLVLVVFLVIAMAYLMPIYGGKPIDMDMGQIAWLLVLSAILFAAGVVIFSAMNL